MFLSCEEKKALLHVGELVDPRGYFDKVIAFSDDNVAILRRLQDKGLVDHEHGQYFLTKAGKEQLDSTQQAEEQFAKQKREHYAGKALDFILGVFTWLLSHFCK